MGGREAEGPNQQTGINDSRTRTIAWGLWERGQGMVGRAWESSGGKFRQ